MYRIPRYTVSLVREGSIPFEGYPCFRNSAEIFQQFRARMLSLDREHFFLLTLDAKNRIIGLTTVSTGSVSTSVVHPREVLKTAILQNASAIVCMHNHPSGDPAPSREDRECTERIGKACEILGIRLLDHIIFGEADYFSFADSGLMNSQAVAAAFSAAFS